MPAISVLPTLASSTPLTDWFAHVSQMYNLVQNQATIIQTLQERVAVLESRANIQQPALAPEPAQVQLTEVKKKLKKVRKTKVAKVAKVDEESNESKEDSKEQKKRGRKPAEVNLSEFLREGEQIIARIPLGDRRFDEHAVAFQEGKLVLEDGQVFDHPTTLVATLAKILEDIGERSTECSRSMNGWILCSVGRDGKRVPLEKLKPSEKYESAEETTEESS
jgi:hypothetical protein